MAERVSVNSCHLHRWLSAAPCRGDVRAASSGRPGCRAPRRLPPPTPTVLVRRHFTRPAPPLTRQTPSGTPWTACLRCGDPDLAAAWELGRGGSPPLPRRPNRAQFREEHLSGLGFTAFALGGWPCSCKRGKAPSPYFKIPEKFHSFVSLTIN